MISLYFVYCYCEYLDGLSLERVQVCVHNSDDGIYNLNRLKVSDKPSTSGSTVCSVA